jgi:N utilization substance protein B
MFLREIPFPIIINEALEIVKEFSDQEGTQFVNGILDAASKEFRPDEVGPKGRRPRDGQVLPAVAPETASEIAPDAAPEA